MVASARRIWSTGRRECPSRRVLRLGGQDKAIGFERGILEVGTVELIYLLCQCVSFCIFAINIHVPFARSQRSHFARKMEARMAKFEVLNLWRLGTTKSIRLVSCDDRNRRRKPSVALVHGLKEPHEPHVRGDDSTI